MPPGPLRALLVGSMLTVLTVPTQSQCSSLCCDALDHAQSQLPLYTQGRSVCGMLKEEGQCGTPTLKHFCDKTCGLCGTAPDASSDMTQKEVCAWGWCPPRAQRTGGTPRPN